MRDTGAGTQRAGTTWLPPTPFMADWLSVHQGRTPHAPAVASATVRLTYGDLADRVGALASDLVASGVGLGSRVLVALPNSPATVVAGLALNMIGATSVELSREWSGDVLGDVLERSACRHAFIWVRDVPKWGTCMSGRTIDRAWVLIGDVPAGSSAAIGDVPASMLLADGRLDPPLTLGPPPPRRALDPDQAALVLYTSGSTGRPHGVIQTFRNIDANSRSIVDYLGLGPSDRAMLTLPLSYCYGRSVLQTHLLAGGSVFLEHRTAFPRTILETMAAEGCTGFAGVPLTFEMIKRQVDVSTVDLSHLRYLTQAGGAMAPETIAWVRESFAPAELFVMYGQTEATARLSYLPPARAAEKPGSVGVAIPGVELRVIDQDGREVSPGMVGEIVARGPNVTPGYLDEPDETARILRDGWLWTGDLGERDEEGFLYHRGRAREILKIGGHRVGPIEIENVVTRYPGVAEAVVIGTPDPLLGEVPIAVVVPSAGTTLDELGLLEFCRANLTALRVPARIVIVDSLPRNAAGKPLRDAIARTHGARREGSKP